MFCWKAESTARLLSFIKKKVGTSFSTRDLSWAIEHNRCHVNGVIERFSSSRLREGDEIKLWPCKKPIFQCDPQAVLFEDDYFLIYNKPPFHDVEMMAEQMSLILVHRLDRDTSGAIIFAKNEESAHKMRNVFEQRQIDKEYLALVEGKPKREKGDIELNMGVAKRVEGATYWKVVKGHKQGVWSRTEWTCEKKGARHSLLRCKPYTGRTHQIRIHLSTIGHPIMGDRVYGNKQGVEGLFRPLLHAHRLVFKHPIQNKRVDVCAPIPDDFLLWMQTFL